MEAKILECIAILINEIAKSTENSFTNQINYGNINIVNNRIIKLISSDIRAIQKAHDILSKNYSNAPSIETIAHKIGYNYSANFSKMFKKTYGKTPLKFRKTK